MEKIVEPDSTEATTTLAEHRIRASVQHEMEKNWKDRMEKEDKITTNKVETLHSQIVRLSEEAVCMKNTHHESAASTVAASTASGGSTSNFAAPVMPHLYRIERLGEVWRNIRDTVITMEEAKGLVSQIKAMIPTADLNKFNWELTDRDQGNSDVKMMTFLWFNENVTPHERWTSNRHWSGPPLESREAL